MESPKEKNNSDYGDLNKIRERIFNPELRSLVSRITDKSESEANKDEILDKLNRLLYRARNIPFYSDDVPILYKKLEQQKQASEEYEQIDALLKAKGCEGFALLCYDRGSMAYTPVVNTTASKKIFIGLHDPVLGKIGRNTKGFFLSQGDGEAIVSGKGFRIFAAPDSEGGHPAAVFLLLCGSDLQLSEISHFVREELKPFDILSGFIRYPNYRSVCGEPADVLLNKTELFFRMAVNRGANVGVFFGIKRKGTYDDMRHNRFMLSSLYTVFQNKMKGYAFFCRLRLDRFALLVRHDSMAVIDTLLEKYEIAKEEPFYCREDIPLERSGGISLWLRKIFL